jgi:GT2 family glycosyltransferase
MQSESIDLSVVIVNYNTRDLLLECLRSIYEKTHSISLECIVVDNVSSDGSVEAVRSAFPQVHLIPSRQNRYFSGGNNLGIAIARGRYIITLNPDMVVLGDTLSQLVRQMDVNPAIGAATTVMYFPDHRLQFNCSREVTLRYLLLQYTFIGKLFSGAAQKSRAWLWYADWDRTTAQPVGVLPGSCIIAPRSLWQAVRGFDERMPMYFSDDYLSRAVRQHNKQTMYLISDGIIHYEGRATRGRTGLTLTRRSLRMYFHDLIIYTGLVFGRPAQLLLTLLLIPTSAVQILKATS